MAFSATDSLLPIMRVFLHGSLAPSQMDDIVYLCDDVRFFSVAMLSRLSLRQGIVVLRDCAKQK